MILFIITRVSSASFRLRLTDSSGLEVSSRKLGKVHHMIIQGAHSITRDVETIIEISSYDNGDISDERQYRKNP